MVEGERMTSGEMLVKLTVGADEAIVTLVAPSVRVMPLPAVRPLVANVGDVPSLTSDTVPPADARDVVTALRVRAEPESDTVKFPPMFKPFTKSEGPTPNPLTRL
jgi:hypothetical protein